MSLFGAEHNFILLPPEWSDASTLTVSNQNSKTPGINLQKPNPSDLWISTSVSSDLDIELDRGSDQFEANGIALFNHNGSSTATWRILAAATQAELDTNPVFDSSLGFGEKLELFGAESITAGPSTQISAFGATGTVEMLFRPKTTLALGLWRIHDGVSNEIEVHVGFDNKLVATMTGDYSLTSSVEVPLDGSYVMVSLVHDTSTVRLYQNGALVASGSLGSVPVGMDELEISPDNPGRWIGDVDEFRLWSDVRTITEIQDNLSAPLTGSEAGLNIYYNMDEGTGTTVGDSAGAAVNGTVTSSAEWGYRDTLWASPGLDDLPRRNSIFVTRPGIGTARWMRVTIKDRNNADGVFQAGRLVVGNGFYPKQSFLIGSTEFVAESQTPRSFRATGRPTNVQKDVVRGAQLNAVSTDEDEISLLKRILTLHGPNTPLALCTEPMDLNLRHEKLFYGTMNRRTRVVRRHNQDWRVQLNLEGWL